MADRAINFGPGPSALPLPVLEEAARGVINLVDGIGVLELSHRSPAFAEVIAGFEHRVRAQLGVPLATHAVLFAQGGGSAQFSAVVLNLLARHRLLHAPLPTATTPTTATTATATTATTTTTATATTAAPDAAATQQPYGPPQEVALDYVVTGTWSRKAVEEARRLVQYCSGGGVNYNVRVAADGRAHSTVRTRFERLPPHDAYTFSRDPALIYYCENETVDGVQFAADPVSAASFPFHRLPAPPPGQALPLVGDHSSSFFSRPIPRLADHAVIFAGAQKNLAPAGLTVLIVRRDCLVDVDAAAALAHAGGGRLPAVPKTMAYKTLADAGSLYNTPSVLSIYVADLVLRRMETLGGLAAYEAMNWRKAAALYAVLREGEEKGVIKLKVTQEDARSWMNVVFDAVGEGAQARFIEGAEKRGMRGLKGHRSIGGLRASLYNAITEEQTNSLIAYIKEFIQG